MDDRELMFVCGVDRSGHVGAFTVPFPKVLPNAVTQHGPEVEDFVYDRLPDRGAVVFEPEMLQFRDGMYGCLSAGGFTDRAMLDLVRVETGDVARRGIFVFCHVYRGGRCTASEYYCAARPTAPLRLVEIQQGSEVTARLVSMISFPTVEFAKCRVLDVDPMRCLLPWP